MYPNLLAEMARQKVTAKELSEKLGVTQGTMSLKMKGNAKFTLEEAKRIKEALGVDSTLEELFASEEV